LQKNKNMMIYYFYNMQAFQPRPIQLPGGEPPLFGGGNSNTPDWSKFVRGGLIVGLVILAIIIISVGRSYATRQNSSVQNQSIRPLGQVHTNNVQVTMPTASEVVRLPLFIQGTARLEWFSKGIFPVEIRDGKNNILAQVYAIADIADPESQTANFRAVVEGFDMAPETRIGRVILYRQTLRTNPSVSDIASIGVDFSNLSGGAWVGAKTTTNTNTDTTTTTTGTGPYGVWTNTQDSTTTKSTTTNAQTKDPAKPYSPYEKYAEVIGGPFTCANGIDDDGDGLIDSEDPSCHTDGYPSNARTYDGDLDEAKRAPTERDEQGNLPSSTGTTSTTNTGGVNTFNAENQRDILWKGNTKIRVSE